MIKSHIVHRIEAIENCLDYGLITSEQAAKLLDFPDIVKKYKIIDNKIILHDNFLNCDIGYTHDFIKNNMKYISKTFQLSQEEIDALVQETIDLAKQTPASLPIQTSFPWYTIPDPGYSTTVKLKLDECDHDWKVYVGLNETDTYCTKCSEKK
jgi:uncharacterized UPF0160 family protein